MEWCSPRPSDAVRPDGVAAGLRSRLPRFAHCQPIEGDYLEIMTFLGRLKFRGAYLYAVRRDLSGGLFACDDCGVTLALHQRFGRPDNETLG